MNTLVLSLILEPNFPLGMCSGSHVPPESLGDSEPSLQRDSSQQPGGRRWLISSSEELGLRPSPEQSVEAPIPSPGV